MNDSIRIRSLCRKYLIGSLTSEELAHFLVYLQDNNGHEILQEEMLMLLKERKHSLSKPVKPTDVLVQEILDTIKKDVQQNKSTTSAAYRNVLHSRWGWAAAAAVLILFGFVAYQWFGYTVYHDKSLVEVPPTEDAGIKPGCSKAILTLANGMQVALDSFEKGAIMKQGNIKIMKINGGQIAYTALQHPSGRHTVSYNTLSTPPGGQYQLTLPDGTKVWLNAASSIHYPTAFIDKERKVDITGEVYFEVARNSTKPFVVKHGNTAIQILGTNFNVNTYEDEDDLKVTLLEGSLKVVAFNSRESKLLKPGEQAQLDPNGQIKLDRHADVEAAIAWKNGLFQFNGTDIHEVMEQIARWYNVDVAYSGTSTQLFYGKISRAATISEVLKMLEMSEGARFMIQGTKIIVMPYK